MDKSRCRILKGLRNAFPQVQFIVSSHAPMVMSSVKSNEENTVYFLHYSTTNDYNIIPIITYGMDLSTISDIILDQTPRAAEVDNQLNNLFSLIDTEKFEDAQRVLQEMQEQYGSNLPELSQAEAMLNCVTTDENEENQ